MSDKFKDVDYEELNSEDIVIKRIRGKVIYYMAQQVADMLDINRSKVDYYRVQFKDILNIEESDSRGYKWTHKDIQKLAYILDLTNKGFTLNQVREHCAEVDFDTLDNGEIEIKESNPMTMQFIAQALMKEQINQMEQFKKDIVDLFSTQLSNQMDVIKDNVSVMQTNMIDTVTTVVDERMKDGIIEFNNTNKENIKEIALTLNNELSEKIDNNISTLNEAISNKLTETNKVIEHNIKICNKMHDNLEKRRMEYKLDQQQSKGWGLFRIFRKRNKGTGI